MDGRVRLTINALSQSFDYFGPYFLPVLTSDFGKIQIAMKMVSSE